jgi:ferredoxin
VHVRVIDAKCCGYTVCADLCPEVYKLDDQGLACVDQSLFPEGLEDKARRGAQGCPESAIEVSDTPFD